MKPDRVIFHIDNSIKNKIQSGCRWDFIIDDLESKVKRYKQRESFIKVSERYLVNNWDTIEWRKRITTMMVIQYNRRIRGIKWVKNSHKNFPQYGSVGMLKLLKLRDIVLYNVKND
jgi:hypothetical protein